MPARKRTNIVRDFDRQWVVEQADKGLAPAAILRVAKSQVDPSDFEHIEDAKECDKAIDYETKRRESVARLTRQMIQYDLSSMRRRALAQGDKRYRAILERTLEELTRLGFQDLRAVLEWGPEGVTARDCWELNEAEAAAVSGVTWTTKTRTLEDGSVETTTQAKLDTHSKTQALRDLLRHLGGYLTITLPVDSEDPDDVIERLLDRFKLEQVSGSDSKESDEG